MKTIKPYGSWDSSLSAEILAQKGNRFGHMCVDGDSVYWLESRATEQGRGVIVQCDSSGNLTDILPDDISVRSKVHEYGSGDFTVNNGVIYFCNADDQCIYQYDGSLTQLTEVNSEQESRYADFILSPDKRFLICVRENHFSDKVVNELISLSLVGSLGKNRFAKINLLHTGFDFYSFPRLTKQGHRLCWTCWNQPDMPWDAAELWVADFRIDGTMDAAHKVAGGGDESNKYSIYQPSWSDDGVLHYISDASGWTNLYSCRDGVLNALTPIDREFGIPQWVLASSTYTLTKDNQIYAVYIQNGQHHLCRIDEASGHVEPIALPYKYFGDHLLCLGNYLYFRGAGPASQEAIYQFDLSTQMAKQLSQIKGFPLPVSELSVAAPIEFESVEQRPCHAFYYKPNNTQFEAPSDTKPPLIVMSHGGPTAMTNNSLDPAIQFWTHRGFAVVDVNYGGSTGFGKKYRDSLVGNWGVVDVEDSIAAANYLVDEGLADKNALLIRGGSAGGYTTLCALTFYNVFAAGMSRYGVADLESLASDSHKFEARYLDSMVGAYPEEKELYQARSPIHFTEQLSCPILLLQGEDDKVVPPNQAEMMVEALDKKKIPYAYRLYKGEGHGFRKAETIVDAFNSELSFYQQVLGIPHNEVDQLDINFLLKG